MATTNLTFNEDVSKRYTTTFTSAGKCAIHILDTNEQHLEVNFC